jgi:opacity protein-like surface antigen
MFSSPLMCRYALVLLAAGAVLASAGPVIPAEPLDDAGFLRMNVELSRLAHQATAGHGNEALAGYLKLLAEVKESRGVPGPWTGILPYLELYIRYEMDWVETMFRGGAAGSWSEQVESLDRARKRRPPSIGAVPFDAAFCQDLVRSWARADQSCDDGRFNEAVLDYDAILDRLDACAPAAGDWVHAAYHLRRFTLIRRVLASARARPKTPSSGTSPGLAPAARADAPADVSFQPTWRFPFAIEIGTRMTAYSLITPRHNYFLGSINELDAEQDAWPYKIFLALQFNSWLGLEGTWDKIRAKTVTDYDKHSDGSIRASGPIVTLQARYPVLSFLTPYLGAGVALFTPNFDYDPVWRNGFGRLYQQREIPWSQAVAEYEAWIAAGAPPWPNDGYQREMELSRGFGIAVLAGCRVRVTDRFSADVMVRYIHLDVDADYRTLRYGELDEFHGSTTFPLSHMAAGLGLRLAL